MIDTLVTIVIASYNNANYIERCLKSVITQTYKNLEILIVDDGSKDDSLSKCQHYKYDRRVRIISKENGGLSSVRQKGLDEATGIFICFIDADDYLNKDYIKNMVHQMTKDQSDVCICSTIVEDQTGIICIPDTQTFQVQQRGPFKLTISALAKRHTNLSGLLSLSDSWNKLYRVSFLKDTNVRFSLPKGYNGTDLVFNHKLALHEPVYSFIGEPGYRHVLYSKSAVRRKNKKLQKGFEFIIKDIIKEAQATSCFELMKYKIINLHYYLLRYAVQDRLDECSSFIGLYNNLHSIIISEKLLYREYPFLRYGYYSMETFSLKVFNLIYHFCPFLLPLFTLARKHFIK